MNRLFILFTERSGSNLLRRMLDVHPDVAAPPAPQLFLHFFRRRNAYGSLLEDQALNDCLRDAIDLTTVEHSHAEWKHELAPDEVSAHVRKHTMAGVLGALYDAYAEREEADTWICKEVRLRERVFEIIDAFPEARFLFLCRDGRDVACSMKKVPTHEKHVYHLAHEWKDEQIGHLEVYFDLLDAEAVHLLRYEDLLREPEGTLQAVCDFADLRYTEDMLQFHQTEEAKRESKKTGYWENLSRPLMRENRGNFLEELSDYQIRVFESVAGDVLDLFGYPLVHDGEPRSVSFLERLWFHVQNYVRKMGQKNQLLEEEGRKERMETLRNLRSSLNTKDAPLKPHISYNRAEETENE